MFHSAFKKDTEKVVLLVVKGLIQIIVRFRAENFLRTFLSPKILLRGMKYQLQKQLCSFVNTIWFMISEQNLTRFTFLHHSACMQ